MGPSSLRTHAATTLWVGAVVYGACGSERITACSIRVQQPERTWPTASNLCRLHQERKDLQRPCRRNLAAMTMAAGNLLPGQRHHGLDDRADQLRRVAVSQVSYGPYGTQSKTSLVAGAPVSAVAYAASYTLPGGTCLYDMHARDYSLVSLGFTSADPLAVLTSSARRTCAASRAAALPMRLILGRLVQVIEDRGIARTAKIQ